MMWRKIHLSYALCLVSMAALAQTELYPKKDGTLWGYCNSSGTMVISAKYADALGFNEKMAAVKSGSLWGYIDSDGDVEITPAYQDAWYFTQGLAAVKKDGLWGYINSSGTVRISFQYEDAADFSDGLAWVMKNGQIGYITLSGTMSIEPQYNAATAFVSGLAGVQKNGKWGFINKSNTVVIPFQYEEARHFDNGLAPVKLYSKWGYVDTEGNLVVAHTYYTLPDDHDNSEFGWAYAKGAYDLLEEGKGGNSILTGHLNSALATIRKHVTYFTKDEAELMLKYYKSVNDDEGISWAKELLKSKKGNSNFSVKGMSLTASTEVVKMIGYKRFRQIPIYGELKIGKFALGARYNSYDNFEDPIRFGAMLTDETDPFPKKYSGFNYSAFLLGYKNSTLVQGVEARTGIYTFVPTDLTLMNNTNFSQQVQIVTPQLRTYDLSYVIGGVYRHKIFYFSAIYSVGLGWRKIDYGFDPDAYQVVISDPGRFDPEKWKNNIRFPLRFNFRAGINLF